ncbi:Scarecrow-like protein 1 [Hibiscus syriacus]|uniref:Scarecrow-like protein 1 n=1 Tax=Hibiscus syriacus TaxID=106335 RepID=A0A6A2WUY9_HIBSY|nr:Scarecrow-like protein 1 [Hibiscus syriacus]
MSLVRSAERAIAACRDTKHYSVQCSGDGSGLSTQMFGTNKHKPIYVTDSYSRKSCEKYFDDSPSEDLTYPSSSEVSGNGEWSGPIRAESIHEPPKESSSLDSNLNRISSHIEASHVSSRTPKQMLIECAAILAEGNIEVASAVINELRQLVSIQGDPPQRIAAYMVEVQRLNGGLEIIGLRLEKLAEVLGVSFEFHAVASRTSLVTPSMLDCQPGEALVVNFAFQLHHMPDESVSTINQRDQLLQMVKSLNPKLVTVVEQDVNTNTSPFFPRFIEAYSYYSTVFESLDATLPRESQDRMNVERQCLARDIVNIVACEGEERIERYEVAGKWRARMTMAGFTSCPMSPNVIDMIRKLIREYCDRYKLEEDLGALHFGWEGKSLIVTSAWR